MTSRAPFLALLGALFALPALAQGKSSSPDASPWDGEWVGTYLCGQGETGLTLYLRSESGGAVAGLFHFWPLASNPEAAEGCFLMAGRPSGGKLPELRLTAGRWLLQPPDYVTVDLAATLDADGQFVGTVGGPGCTSVLLRRATSPVPLPAPCASP